MEPLELFTRREILSVSELVARLKRLTEDHFEFVWVQGEVSGLRRPASGHLYFQLKDNEAALRAVLFRPQAALLRFSLEDGQEVLCQGRLSVYQPRGEVQLVVDTVEPRGAGALALAFEQLRRKLQAEGLFDAARKRSLPLLPRRVAVITSPSGAAISDFLRVLHRRFAGVEVAIYPVPVQGRQAAGRMIQALSDLADWDWPQVIVITRGGGSPEDLMPFNDEALARAVAESPLPVVSAVGHEIDLTICDLVADLRAPTPSAAAEMLVASRSELLRGLGSLWQRLSGAGRRLIAERRMLVQGLQRALADPRRGLADRRLRLDDLMARARHGLRAVAARRREALLGLGQRLATARPDRRLALAGENCRQLQHRLAGAQAAAIWQRRAELERLEGRLRALSPLAVLSRGFALVHDRAGELIRRADQVRPGQRLVVRLSQGRLRVWTEGVEP